MCDRNDDPTQHNIAADIARARVLGITVSVNAESDRVAPDTRNPATACPTCDEGVLTVVHSRRCRECMAVGL
jgi:hypothetical protein